MDGMVRIPGATFLMGSDDHYPGKPRRTRSRWAGSGWTRARSRTGIGRFVRKSGYVAVAEGARSGGISGARPELLVPFSSVSIAPPHRVDLADPYNWWKPSAALDLRHLIGPGSFHPQPAGPSGRARDRGRRARLTPRGQVRLFRTEAGAGAGGVGRALMRWSSPGATTRTRTGAARRDSWEGEFPARNMREDGYERNLIGRRVPGERRRPVRHDRQRLGVDIGLVRGSCRQRRPLLQRGGSRTQR